MGAKCHNRLQKSFSLRDRGSAAHAVVDEPGRDCDALTRRPGLKVRALGAGAQILVLRGNANVPDCDLGIASAAVHPALNIPPFRRSSRRIRTMTVRLLNTTNTE